MKKNITIGIIILILCFFYSIPHVVAQDIPATTSTGVKVILHNDGTWTADETAVIPKAGDFEKSPTAKDIVKGKRIKYSVRYDKSKWKLQKSNSNEDSEYQFEHASGEGWAMVIPERVEVSLDALRKGAVENVKAVAPDAQVVSEDSRTVNGNTIRCLQINGTVDGIPISYFNYYYTGKAGSVQFMTYTTQNLFEEYKNDFTELLNGFEIIK